MKHRIFALVTAVAVLAITAFVDHVGRSAHLAEVRASVGAQADSLARGLSDVVVRESAAVETLSAFVEITADDQARLNLDFPVFAAALMDVAPKIRSVQLAPSSILDFVYPLEGNERAVGLDLMSDPDRKALLEPAIDSGETVIQGPVELVQGGLGLIVRRPVYEDDGRFWGFAAIVLDWPSIAADTGFSSAAGSMTAGLRRAGTEEVIAGSSEAFAGDPVIRTLQVGATATTWSLAMQPAGGWPTRAPTTSTLWIAGALVALIGAFGVAELLGRPEALRVEREKALRDLALAEARYEATFQNAGVGIVIADPAGSVVSANQAFKGIVGDESDLSGRSVAEFIHPDDLFELRRLSRHIVDSGQVVEWEARLLRAGGERWCRVRMTTLGGESAPFFIGVVEDITARRAAEAALAESEIRYRHLFQAAPIAIQRQDFSEVKRRLDQLRSDGVEDLEQYLGDTDSLAELVSLIRVTDANPAAIELNARLGSASASEDLRELLTDEARQSFVANLLAIWEGLESVSIPVSPTTAEGEPMHLDLKWQPVPIGGTLDYSQVMVTINDVTHLTETQRRLEDLLASKDRFLASVAHELRTPLTAVVGFAQELSGGRSMTDSERGEFIGLVAQNSIEMSHLIEDLLVVARAEIGEVHVVSEVVDVPSEVAAVLRLLPDHGVEVHKSGGSTSAIADPSRVRQIVRNLVTNALRYGGGDVSVGISRSNGHVYVDVGDDGAPIPPKDAMRIFEPYQRLRGSASAPGSIGLGLTVSRALARVQGGDVEVLREGNRNVFRLSLPAGP